MVLEMVDHRPVLGGVHQPRVTIPSLILLPLQVDEGGSGVGGLDPVGPALHNLADDGLIVAFAQVVLNGRRGTVRALEATFGAQNWLVKLTEVVRMLLFRRGIRLLLSPLRCWL